MRYVKCRPIVERSAIVALLILAGSAASVRADIVFSNVDTTACGCGIGIIKGQNYGPPESLAEEFTPAANYSLTGAEARLIGGVTGTVNFALFSNAINVPGVSLDQLGSVTVSNSQEGVFSASTPANPLVLLANVPYWLVLTPGTAGTFVGWEAAGSSSQPYAFTSDPTGATGWNSNYGTEPSQFQIDGTPAAPVPEPASVWLCLAPLGITGIRYVKRGAARL